MKNRCLILLQILFFVLLTSLPALAAPTLDGIMGTDWTGFQVEEDNLDPIYGGQDFDVEKIGLYVNDSTLIWGLQTGFDLKANKVDGIQGGDFALDFDSDGTFEFGFKYKIMNNDSARVQLFIVDSWKDPNPYIDSAPWKIDKGTRLLSSSSDKMDASYGEHTSNGDNHYTLEVAVDLDILTAKLENLYGPDYNFGNVTAHWTMQCGNDVLETTYSKADYSQTPEPATLLLFGMGLLGAGAYGRKRTRQDDK